MGSENPCTTLLGTVREQEEGPDAFAGRNGIVDHFTSPVIGPHASENPELCGHELARREEVQDRGATSHRAIETTVQDKTQERQCWRTGLDRQE